MQPEIELAYRKWSKGIRLVYRRGRQAMIDAVSVKGKMSGPVRLACARYGAWCAVSAIEVELMSLWRLGWSGLMFPVKLKAGLVYWASDNWNSGFPKGAVVYRVAELWRMLELKGVGMTVIQQLKTWPGAEVLGNRPVKEGLLHGSA